MEKGSTTMQGKMFAMITLRRIRLSILFILFTIKILLITTTIYANIYMNDTQWFKNLTDQELVLNDHNNWLNTITVDSKNLNHRLSAGYYLNDYFATEVGYGYFLEQSTLKHSKPTTNLEIKQETDISSKLIWPIMKNINTYVNLGVSYIQPINQNWIIDNNNILNHAFALRYGFGMSLNMNKHFVTSVNLIYISQHQALPATTISTLNCTFYLN